MIDLRAGDCRHVLAAMPANSVDAVVTDPPYELGFMGKKWDGTGIAYDVGMWAEVLRVLKPGGHLLSFGGTRTWHRMACAVEDAGFEMRDSIAWLYGSGFPKSLDVGKAIDKRGGRPDLAAEVAAHLRSAREARGMTVGQADRQFCGGSTNWSWFEGRKGECRPPTPGTFAAIAAAWPEVAHLAASIAEAEREVTGTHSAGLHTGPAGVGGFGAGAPRKDAPATPDAAKWDGWGTALKPAHEPIVVARKPLVGTVAANVVAHGTGALNIDACRIGTVGGYTNHTAAGEGEGWNGNTSTGSRTDNGGRWPANVVLDETCADLLDEQSGTLTTGAWTGNRNAPKFGGAAASTYSGGTFTGEEKPRPADSGGASRFFKRVDWSEGDSVVAWRQDRATTADNSSSQPRPADGSAPSDAATSASLAAKPSSSSQTGRPTTVATPSASRPNAETGTPAMPTTASASWQGQPPDEHSQTPSRARSAETPTLTGTTTTTPSRSPSGGSAANTTSAGTSSSTAPGVKVLDGADRFIYCAKAPTKERPRHDGTAHPTVKPLTLMRWLVRLVTPPDGTVLDPFAGSGTTLEAALLEGFHAIGIEQNPDYLPLIRQRLARHDDTLFGATA